MDSVNYIVSDENFPNPERGFYGASEISNTSSGVISKVIADAHRKQGRTLYLLEFHLADFVSTPISEDYIQHIKNCFQSLRDNGAKCILRFCYSLLFCPARTTVHHLC